MPQTWSQPKEKMEKQAVFSPYSGDGTAASCDRAVWNFKKRKTNRLYGTAL